MGDTSRLQGLRIVVIDEDEDTRALLDLLLSAHGATTQVARTGREGLSLLRTQPDVVLCEVFMPDMQAVDLLKRARSAGSSAMFCLMTGRRTGDMTGFAHVWLKPIDTQEVIATLATVPRIAHDRGSGVRRAVTSEEDPNADDRECG